jgi:hypothetical protein
VEQSQGIYNRGVQGGYSPEMANIMARNVVDADMPGQARKPYQAPGPQGISYQGRPEGAPVLGGESNIDYGAMEARANQMRIGAVTGGRMDQGAMGLTRDLRGMAGQGMTREKQDRFLAERENQWFNRMNYNQRGEMFNKEQDTIRYGQDEQTRRTRAEQEGQTDRTKEEQSGLNARAASEMALQGRLVDMSGFKTGPGGESVYQGPKGAVENMQPTEEQKARTWIGKMNEDLERGKRGEPGGITQEQYDAEMARRAQGGGELAAIAQELRRGTPPPAGGAAPAAGGQPITKWTPDGRKVVSTDGGKTFRPAQ